MRTIFYIQQIEVYKGSNGAHFGPDAIGGAVNFITDIDYTNSYSINGFSYDKDYKQFPCKCKSKKCCGYIVREGSRWRINKKFKITKRANK